MYLVGQERVPFFAACGPMFEVINHKDEVMFVLAGQRTYVEGVVAKLNEQQGWYIWQTGGGNTAWRLDLDPEHHILVTQDLSHELEVKGLIEVGLYFTGEGSSDGGPEDYAELEFGRPLFYIGKENKG